MACLERFCCLLRVGRSAGSLLMGCGGAGSRWPRGPSV